MAISCQLELGTTVGYSTAFLATFVASKRQLFGALLRQTPRSGFLGWPPAALAFTFDFSGFLTTTWPATRGKLLTTSKTKENKQHSLATNKAKKATGEKHDEELANDYSRRRKEGWPPWELLYFEDILVPVRLWRSGTASRSTASGPSSSEAACVRLIHVIHDDHHHCYHRH